MPDERCALFVLLRAMIVPARPKKIDCSGLPWVAYPLTLLPHRVVVLADVSYSLTASTRENLHLVVTMDDDEYL